ncbi:Aste57867_25267 [Aphanomyces stellatus]|uniref:Aste57867_25267 protein n=1 Tax=Aphanomyces stellatus TaxID=120398 RepID=A0A485LXC3_9STRA|nr:hypothetical protein As57867_025189 [Aphanomyces stellatus]VFU01893.1 Aste57867_25267 [Aphanomyces stellatus]
MSDVTLSSSASACLHALRDSKDCAWLSEASHQGIKQLNAMLNIDTPLEPIEIVQAVDKPVAGPYQKKLIQMQVQVAPQNKCNANGVCDFNLDQSATYQLLLSQAAVTEDKWTLIDSLQVQSGSSSLDGGPQKAATAPHPSFKFLPPFAFEVLVVAACIFGLTALLVLTVRARRNGYASLHKSSAHAQLVAKKVRRVDLKRSNPVPTNEEKVLRHSHEKNERFAV